jgi:hypothetical protein
MFEIKKFSTSERGQILKFESQWDGLISELAAAFLRPLV